MVKKLISAVAAAAIVFGSAAALPQGVFDDLGTGITARAVYIYEDYFYELCDDGTVEIIGYSGNHTDVTIPSEIGGRKVTKIGDSAFEYENFKSITIPNSVKTIGKQAFRLCEDLTSITIPSSVKSIGSSAFFCCSSLTSITLSSGITSIDDRTFNSCRSLKSITIPNNITSIGLGAFGDCTSLESISIPSSVKEIGTGVFYNTPWLDAQIKKNPLVIINNIVIEGKTCEGNITIPNGVTRINDQAFNNPKTPNLMSVTLPDSVTSIGKQAFNNCEGLTSINIPKSVTSIGIWAFSGCKFLTIKCYAGSVGEEAAKNDGVKIEYLTPPHTHSYTSKVTKAATCTADGVKTYTCSCGESYTETIKATGHSYTAKVVKPTYDAEGYTLHTCSACGDSYKDNITAKLTRTSIAKATITGLKSKYYTGKALTQTPVVKLGSKTLKSGTDYTVSYKNNKNVGTATVTITGKGNYNGTVKTTFKICPKKTAVKKLTSPKTKQLKVTYGKVAGVTGYQITYSTSSKFTKKTTKSVNAAGTSKTIKKLTKGKTYYVKVRTYKTVGKTKYYSGYSAVKKIKVK